MCDTDPILTEREIDDFIILRAVAFSNKIQRMMQRSVLRAEGLPVLEWRVLFSIARFGACHLAYITGKTALDPAHASRAAAALVRKGLLKRHADPDDHRRRVLRMTPEGRAVFDRVWPRAQSLIQNVTQELPAQDLALFKRLLDRVNELAEPLVADTVSRSGRVGQKEDTQAA